jgi:hypothetical protein
MTPTSATRPSRRGPPRMAARLSPRAPRRRTMPWPRDAEPHTVGARPPRDRQCGPGAAPLPRVRLGTAVAGRCAFASSLGPGGEGGSSRSLFHCAWCLLLGAGDAVAVHDLPHVGLLGPRRLSRRGRAGLQPNARTPCRVVLYVLYRPAPPSQRRTTNDCCRRRHSPLGTNGRAKMASAMSAADGVDHASASGAEEGRPSGAPSSLPTRSLWLSIAAKACGSSRPS